MLPKSKPLHPRHRDAGTKNPFSTGAPPGGWRAEDKITTPRRKRAEPPNPGDILIVPGARVGVRVFRGGKWVEVAFSSTMLRERALTTLEGGAKTILASDFTTRRLEKDARGLLQKYLPALLSPGVQIFMGSPMGARRKLSRSLRAATIRLAFSQPGLRRHLLPLLKQSSIQSAEEIALPWMASKVLRKIQVGATIPVPTIYKRAKVLRINPPSNKYPYGSISVQTPRAYNVWAKQKGYAVERRATVDLAEVHDYLQTGGPTDSSSKPSKGLRQRKRPGSRAS